MIHMGKLDLNQIIPDTFTGIISAPVVAGLTFIATESPAATVSTLAIMWLTNQWMTRHKRDGYLLDSPLDDLAKEDTKPTNHITKALADYGIKNAKAAGEKPGPVLIRHLIRLESGTKLGTLPDEDLARDLGVDTVTISKNAGKKLIGIDIPRPDRQYLTLTDLLESEAWENRDTNMKLPCCPAVDQFGNPVVFDIASLPHLITAGTTGSGKSVFVNAMLLSLIHSGCEFKLMIADGKGEDFAPQYKNSSHLINVNDFNGKDWLPPNAIATEIQDMRAQLLWLAAEMDRRFATGEKPFPIIFTMDEKADVVMQDDKEKTIIKTIARIAQKGRSANIHMLLITQYPTADVVHPLIAANTPSRAGLMVDKDHQSKVVIGGNGCEKLQGKGDCYLKIAGKGIKRIHGANVIDADFKRLLN